MQRRVHFHQMLALGEAAFLHVGDVFAEGGEAFLLEAAVFGGEVGSPEDTGRRFLSRPQTAATACPVRHRLGGGGSRAT